MHIVMSKHYFNRAIHIVAAAAAQAKRSLWLSDESAMTGK